MAKRKLNKKGFTLIELIGTIVIISLILLIIVPNITNMTKKAKDNSNKQFIENVILAAKNWGADNKDKLPKNQGSFKDVLVTLLQDEGYLDKRDLPQEEGTDYNCVRISDITDDNQSKKQYDYVYPIKNGSCTDEDAAGYTLTIRGYKEGTNALYTSGKWTNQNVILKAIVIKDGSEITPTGNYSWYKDSNMTPFLKGPSSDYIVKTKKSIDASYSFSIDSDNNKHSNKFGVKIDKVKPTIEPLKKGGDIEFTFKDSDSGIMKYEIEIKTASTPPSIEKYVGNISNIQQNKEKKISIPYKSGVYVVKVWDDAGNVAEEEYSNTLSNNCKIEIVEGNLGENDWYTSNVKLKLKTALGINKKGLTISGQAEFNNKDTVTVSQDGTFTYYGYVDNGTAEVGTCSKTIKIDKTPPTTPVLDVTHSYNSTLANGSKAIIYTNGDWINKEVYLTDARWNSFIGPHGSTDSGSGLPDDAHAYEISSDNKNWTKYAYSYSNNLYVIRSDGTHNRYFRAVDNAGNKSAVLTKTIKRDTAAPTCTFKATKCSGTTNCAASSNNYTPGDWYSGSVTTYAACSVTSGSPCISTKKVTSTGQDNNVTKQAQATRHVNKQGGNVTITWYVYDEANNEGSCGAKYIKLDRGNPTCKITVSTGCGQLKAGKYKYKKAKLTDVKDPGGSGVNKTTYLDQWWYNNKSTSGCASSSSPYSQASFTEHYCGEYNRKVHVKATLKDKAGNTGSCSETFYTNQGGQC